MALTNITPEQLCLKIQKNLTDVVGDIPQNIEPLGTLKAVTSTENTSGFEPIRNTTADGKTFSASVKFRAPQCYTATEEEVDVCDDLTAASNPNKEYSVTVGEIATHEISLNAEDFRTLCDTLESRKSFELVEGVAALKRKINLGLVNKIAANMNNYYDGDASTIGTSTEKVLKLFTTDGKPNTMGLFQLKQQYNKLGYGAMSPIVVGGDPLDAWKFAQAQFAGNADKAYDVSKIQGMNMFSDYKIDDVAGDGDQHLISWIPGHLQLLRAYEYKGDYATVRQEGSRMVYTMPDGFQFDMAISNAFCDNGLVKMVMSARWDLFRIPSTAFGTCSAKGSVLGWQTSCAAVDCSDLKVLS